MTTPLKYNKFFYKAASVPGRGNRKWCRLGRNCRAAKGSAKGASSGPLIYNEAFGIPKLR